MPTKLLQKMCHASIGMVTVTRVCISECSALVAAAIKIVNIAYGQECKRYENEVAKTLIFCLSFVILSAAFSLS